jgi:hypothetical protein
VGDRVRSEIRSVAAPPTSAAAAQLLPQLRHKWLQAGRLAAPAGLVAALTGRLAPRHGAHRTALRGSPYIPKAGRERKTRYAAAVLSSLPVMLPRAFQGQRPEPHDSPHPTPHALVIPLAAPDAAAETFDSVLVDDVSPGVSPARRARKAALMTRSVDNDHRTVLQVRRDCRTAGQGRPAGGGGLRVAGLGRGGRAGRPVGRWEGPPCAFLRQSARF